MYQSDQLPAGVTEEMANEIYRHKAREYQRNYKREHPDRVVQQRITTYTNFLKKHGYTVTAPQEGGES